MGGMNTAQVDPCGTCNREDICTGCTDVDMVNGIDPEIQSLIDEICPQVDEIVTKRPREAGSIMHGTSEIERAGLYGKLPKLDIERHEER